MRTSSILSSFLKKTWYTWWLSLTIEKFHWNEICQRTDRWILSFYMRNKLVTLRYYQSFFFKRMTLILYFIKTNQTSKGAKKKLLCMFLFDFTSDAFLKLLKGNTICSYDLIVSVNSIMFISPSFLVNKFQFYHM